MKRATAKGSLSVNQTTTQDYDDTIEVIEQEPDPTPEPEETVLEAEINKIVSRAQQEAHPSDTRQVLGGTGKKTATAQVKFAEWSDETEWHDARGEDHNINEILGEYEWESDDVLDFQWGG